MQSQDMWCVHLNEQSIKTGFSSSYGKFQFSCLFFGLSDSLAVFVALLDQVLQGLSHFTLAYTDDVLVLTKTNIHDHIKHSEQVFDHLKQHKVKLKMTKYDFA